MDRYVHIGEKDIHENTQHHLYLSASYKKLHQAWKKCQSVLYFYFSSPLHPPHQSQREIENLWKFYSAEDKFEDRNSVAIIFTYFRVPFFSHFSSREIRWSEKNLHWHIPLFMRSTERKNEKNKEWKKHKRVSRDVDESLLIRNKLERWKIN